MHRLNPQQAAAVRNISSPLLVLAGAGSGKTSVITQKITHLVKACGFQPEHIAAVTEAIETTGALEYTARSAQQEASSAIASLTDVPESEYKQALIGLAEFAANRRY